MLWVGEGGVLLVAALLDLLERALELRDCGRLHVAALDRRDRVSLRSKREIRSTAETINGVPYCQALSSASRDRSGEGLRAPPPY